MIKAVESPDIDVNDLMPAGHKVNGTPNGLIKHLVSLYPPPNSSVTRSELDRRLSVYTLSPATSGMVISAHLAAVKDPILTTKTFLSLGEDIVKPADARGRDFTVKGQSGVVSRNLKKKRDLILEGRQMTRMKTKINKKQLNLDPDATPETIISVRRKNYFFPTEVGMGVALKVGGKSVRRVVDALVSFEPDANNLAYVDQEGGLPSLKLKCLEDIVRTITSRFVLNDEILQNAANIENLSTKVLQKTPSAGLSKTCINTILKTCIELDREESGENKLVDLNKDNKDRVYYGIDFRKLEAGSKAEKVLRGLNTPIGKDEKVTRATMLAEERGEEVVEEVVVDESAGEGLVMARRLLKVLDNRGLEANVSVEAREMVRSGVTGVQVAEESAEEEAEEVQDAADVEEEGAQEMADEKGEEKKE